MPGIRVRCPRVRVGLSTLLGMTLTAAVLLGINVHPYSFYYPRPPWVEDLKYLVVDREHPDALFQCGVYGWPFPAYPSWTWAGNGDFQADFPHWSQYRSGVDIRVACTWQEWNKRALFIDVIVNLAILALVAALLRISRKVAWALRQRWLEKNVGHPGIAPRAADII